MLKYVVWAISCLVALITFASPVEASLLSPRGGGGGGLLAPGIQLGTTSPYAQVAIDAIEGVTDNRTPIFAIGDFGTTSPFFIVDALGKVSILNASTTGSASIANLLNVLGSGTSTFAGGLSSAGFLSSAGLRVSAGDTVLAGGLAVTGSSNLTGAVGIGTTTPGATLSVTGSGIINNTLTVGGVFKATSTALLALNGGNVGIGTSSPGSLLSISGPFLANGTSTIEGGGLIAQALFSTSSLNFYTNSNIAPRLVVKSSGNVGIGTTTPFDIFGVEGAASATTSPVFGASNKPTCIQIYTPDGSAVRLFASNGATGVARGALVSELGSCQ